MARIGGVDLPKGKKIGVALTYVFGVGPFVSQRLLSVSGVSDDIRVKDLSEGDIVKLRDALRSFEVEGDLRRRVSQDIRRLSEIGSFRGSRHRKKLPCRGQRTHTNARTRRGKRIAIAGKKKVTK